MEVRVGGEIRAMGFCVAPVLELWALDRYLVSIREDAPGGCLVLINLEFGFDLFGVQLWRTSVYLALAISSASAFGFSLPLTMLRSRPALSYTDPCMLRLP